MTVNAFMSLVTQHWVLLVLVLCPIAVVMMALAALTCEACGAPFGIFRRRSRTIDLCLRCAVLHDIRQASDLRQKKTDAKPTPAPPVQSPEDPREDRRYAAHPAAGLGAAGQPGTR